jgi:hypothetical protein
MANGEEKLGWKNVHRTKESRKQNEAGQQVTLNNKIWGTYCADIGLQPLQHNTEFVHLVNSVWRMTTIQTAHKNTQCFWRQTVRSIWTATNGWSPHRNNDEAEIITIKICFNSWLVFLKSSWYKHFTFAFLGAFAKLQLLASSWSICVSPSVRPHGTTRLSMDRLSWNFLYFRKSAEKIQFQSKSDTDNGYFA